MIAKPLVKAAEVNGTLRWVRRMHCPPMDDLTI